MKRGKPKSIDGYLEAAGSPAPLVALRKTIRKLAPDAVECISYGIPAFRLRGKVIAGFHARSKGYSYFPFSGSTLRAVAKDVAKYPQTKSALHFDRALPESLVRKLLKARIAEL